MNTLIAPLKIHSMIDRKEIIKMAEIELKDILSERIKSGSILLEGLAQLNNEWRITFSFLETKSSNNPLANAFPQAFPILTKTYKVIILDMTGTFLRLEDYER